MAFWHLGKCQGRGLHQNIVAPPNPLNHSASVAETISVPDNIHFGSFEGWKKNARLNTVQMTEMHQALLYPCKCELVLALWLPPSYVLASCSRAP